MIEIIKDLEELSRIAPFWRRLEVDDNMRIFQTYNWNRSAWESFYASNARASLCIIHWSAGEDHVILPTYIDGKGILRFIYDEDSDVCDAVYEKSRNHHIAYWEMAKKIKSDLRIKGVWLQKMRGESEVLNYLSVLLRGGIVAKDNAFSWLNVVPSSDFIASQTHMKSKDRSDLKCFKRQVGGYRLRVVSKSAGDAFPADALKCLRDAMCRDGRRDYAYFQNDSLDFASKIYNASGCDVALLESDDGLQAANILLKKDNRMLSWVFLYKDSKASTILYLKYFCEQIYFKPYIFDFGVGVYSYKIGTFRPCLELTHSLRWSKSLMGYLSMLMQTNIRVVKDIVKAIREK